MVALAGGSREDMLLIVYLSGIYISKDWSRVVIRRPYVCSDPLDTFLGHVRQPGKASFPTLLA